MTERFVKTYSQGCIDVIEIWVDTVTGRFLKSLIQAERYTRWKNRITGTDEKTVY